MIDATRTLRYRNHLRYLCGTLAGIALLIPSIAGAQASASAAARLVTAMRIDEVTLIGLRLGLQRGVRDGKASSQALDCVNKLDRTAFTSVFVQAISVNLSTQEATVAAAFFDSATGRKYIDSGIFQLHQAIGITPPNLEPSVSDADLQAVAAFSRTSAGDKLLVKRIFDAPETRSAIGARVQQVLNGCGGQ
jgi:hypothetical protein